MAEVSLEEEVARNLTQGEFQLPLKPEIVTRVLAMARNPDTCFAHLSRLIHNDPMLAAHVIRVANSPAYAGRVRITTLRQAVTRIGMRVLSELAITAGISEVFRVPGYEDEAADIWQHALMTAGFCREVGRFCRVNEEAAFLCGLLHTIGRPLILRTAVQVADRLGVELARGSVEAFMARWEVEVGQRLSESWELPHPVRETITHYRDFTQATEHRALVAVTALASRMATLAMESGGECDPACVEAIKGHPTSWELRLSPEQIDQILERSEEVRMAVEAMAA